MGLANFDFSRVVYNSREPRCVYATMVLLDASSSHSVTVSAPLLYLLIKCHTDIISCFSD
jgi:hypothetical protein